MTTMLSFRSPRVFAILLGGLILFGAGGVARGWLSSPSPPGGYAPEHSALVHDI